MQGLITVFGGTGFVGRYVVRSLARHGWRVRVAARKIHTAPELKVMGDVGQIELVQCNVRDRASVERALEDATGVVNLVGVLFESGKQGFQTLHTQAAAEIAELAAERGITHFVQMSALGASPDSPALYARTKAAGEQAVTMAIPSATILRPSIVFGPEDDFFNRFAQLAGISPVLPLIGGGHTRFQPVYAGDLGEAVACLFDNPALQGRTYEIGGPGDLQLQGAPGDDAEGDAQVAPPPAAAVPHRGAGGQGGGHPGGPRAPGPDADLRPAGHAEDRYHCGRWRARPGRDRRGAHGA